MTDAPIDAVHALLSFIAKPEAAKKLADQLAEVKAAKADLEKLKTELDGREKELSAQDASLRVREAELKLERDQLDKQENSLTERANKIKAGEESLQNDRLAHAKEHSQGSENLNNREQAVTAREQQLQKQLAKLAADRAALDKKLAKAKEFIDAA